MLEQWLALTTHDLLRGWMWPPSRSPLFSDALSAAHCSALQAIGCTHLADVAGCTESATSFGMSADRIGCPAMPLRAYVPLTLAMTGSFVFLNGLSFGARLGSLYD